MQKAAASSATKPLATLRRTSAIADSVRELCFCFKLATADCTCRNAAYPSVKKGLVTVICCASHERQFRAKASNGHHSANRLHCAGIGVIGLRSLICCSSCRGPSGP